MSILFKNLRGVNVKKRKFGIIIVLLLMIILMVGVIIFFQMKTDETDVLTSEHGVFNEQLGTEEIDDMTDDNDEFLEGTEESFEGTESKDKNNKTNSSSEKNKKENYPYYIRVNRLANCVTVYKKDANGKYTVPVKSMICSVGLTGETPLGVTKIKARYLWRPLFGGTYGQYTVRFNGHILFHSVPYTKISKDALKQGEYNKLGMPASQGCIRLTVADAKWIYDNCKNGTKVEVYESTDPGPLGKPTITEISEDSPYAGWDPTDPDAKNPWKKGQITIKGVKDIVVKQNDTINYKDGVSAIDVDGMPLEVIVLNKVDTKAPGVYTITYSATGVTGTKTVTAKVMVNAINLPEIPEGTEVPESPGGTEIPGDTEMPGDTEIPDDTEFPGGTEIPEGTENSGGTENPGGTEIPGGTEHSGDTEIPGDKEAPGDT